MTESMEKMKSAVFFAPKDMRVVDTPRPRPRAHQVLIQVMACGVCGSDVHIFHGDQGSTETIPPQIQGHEFSGIVSEIGSGVLDFKVGDRVCVDPADHCQACYYCSNGMISHCERMGAIGTNIDGGFAQYCAVPARLLHRIEGDVTFVEAAMAEPLACCIHGIDRSDIQVGDPVLIYGGGTIGLLLLQLALLRGASRIALVEPVEAKRAAAKLLGADLVIDPNTESVREVLQRHGFFHVRVIIETCGLQATAEEAVDIIDRAGTILLFAVTDVQAAMQLKTYQLFQKELTVRGSFCSPGTMGRAVELIQTHKIDVRSILAGKTTLSRLPFILSDPQERAKGKWMVMPNGNLTGEPGCYFE